MSTQTDNTLRNTTRKPFMLGYTVRPIGDGEKSIWTRIGAAWEHKDGKGMEVRMDALPVDGRLVLRTAPDDPIDARDYDRPSPNAPG